MLGGGALANRKRISAGRLPPAVMDSVASPPRLASSAAVTCSTGLPLPETLSPSSSWVQVPS